MKENKIHRMFGHPLLYVSILSLPGGCVFGTHAGAGKKVDPAAGPKTETKTKKAPPTKKKAATTAVVGTAGAGTGSGGGGSTPAPTVPPSTGSSSSNSLNPNSSPGPVSNKPTKPTLDEVKKKLIAAVAGGMTNEKMCNALLNGLTSLEELWSKLDTEKKVDADGVRMSDEAFKGEVNSWRADLEIHPSQGNTTELKNDAQYLLDWMNVLTASDSQNLGKSEKNISGESSMTPDEVIAKAEAVLAGTNKDDENIPTEREDALHRAVLDLVELAGRLGSSSEQSREIHERTGIFLNEIEDARAAKDKSNLVTILEAILTEALKYTKTLLPTQVSDTNGD